MRGSAVRWGCVLGAAWLLRPSLAWSQAAAANAAPPAPAPASAAEPPAADPRGPDWLVLVSEEVLKGKLISLRQKSLVFQSAKLGERTDNHVVEPVDRP